MSQVIFCTPRGDAYICVPREPYPIIFSSFTAINVTGERLSHAVGYAFKACLAKKKEIEKANQTLSQESNFPYKEKSVDVQSPGMCISHI